MKIHRRQFLKYCIGSAEALSLPMTVIGRLEEAMAAGGASLPKVIWLNGANCTGCTVSLANLFSDSGPTDVADLLFNTIDLMFHPNLMGAAGDLAVQQLKDTAAGSYILAVEGGIPTAFNGHSCLLWTDQGRDVTAMEAVQMLAPGAAAILCVGSCSSFGGIPAGNPNPTGIVSVSKLTGLKTVNIPGCPTHPDWIVWTVAHLLSGQMPVLDGSGRPAALYSTEIHKNCPRKGKEEAKTFGVANQCLKELGCRGPKAKTDCPTRKWNSGSNWCIGAGSLCIGCTESSFPDGFSPFYNLTYSYAQFEKPPVEEPNPGEEPAPEPTQGTLQITKARWDSGRRELQVEGKGPKGQIVTVYNDISGAKLGAVSVSSDGKWKYRKRISPPIPTRVKAVCNSLVARLAVANAPTRS